MSEGSKWTPGKIFLLIVGILFALGIVCCGGGYFLFKDKIRAAIDLGKESGVFVERLQKEVGPGTTFQPLGQGRKSVILLIGVTGDLTPERVTELQDKTWKIFAESYHEHGFVPVKELAIGKVATGKDKTSGDISDWSHNLVTVEELVKRTGVQPPPVSSIVPDGKGSFEVNVTTGDDEKPKEEVKVVPKEEKKDDGAGGK